MWFAILLTIFAATGNNIGKALQKEAVHSLPRFSLEPGVLRQYLRSRIWLLGLSTDLAGALLMIGAFALAPVSLVQPVSGVGLVSLALFSHFHLKERLQAGEWGSVALAMIGTVGLGVSAEDKLPEGDLVTYGVVRIGTVVLFLLFLMSAFAWGARLTASQKRRTVGGASTAASVYGLQAGACFGLSAASCKTGLMLVKQMTWVAFPLGMVASVLFSSLGFMLQTLGLKDGNTVIVCTCAAVSSMATGVLVGIMVMGEPLPSTFNLLVLRLLSWLVTIAGVSALANGKGGFKEVARLALALLPRRLLPFLPASLVAAKRSSSSKDLRLPTVDPSVPE